MPVRRMTSHTLEVIRGFPALSAVQFTAKISPNVTINPVYAGRVCHLNSNLELEMGISGTKMALFLWNNSDDPTVKNYGGEPASDFQAWVSINPESPSDNVLVFPANGAFEVASTEYDKSLTYQPNDLLTATPSNTDPEVGGRLTKATLGTHAICGVVSRGVRTNAHGQPELCFWSVWLPAGV